MSTEALTFDSETGLVASLNQQYLEQAGLVPRLLVIYSDEIRRRSPGRWEATWEEALFLRTAGGEVDSFELGEALEHALENCGIEEIVLIGESDRAHHAVPEPELPRGASIIERIGAGNARHRAELSAAKDSVRRGVASLRKSAAGRARVYGLVEVGEGGPLLAFDEVADEFTAVG